MSSPITVVPRSPSSGRNLNSVQRTLRTLIWFLIFGVLAVITLVMAGLLGAFAGGPWGVVVLTVGGLFSLIIPGMVTRCLYVIPEYLRVVILKLGKFDGVRGPGKFWVVPYPPFYQSVTAELDVRVQTRAITAAQTLTRDNVPVGCEAVLFWRVEDPQKAALNVSNYAEAVFQAANSALKDTVGTLELSELLSERDKVAQQLKNVIDAAAASFGVDVTAVEITDVHVPDDLIQELSVLAQSRRSAQAKIAEVEVEMEVAQKLQEAAKQMGPEAMELYRLGVLERIGREEGSQIVVYGMGSSNLQMDQQVAAAAAGTAVAQNKS